MRFYKETFNRPYPYRIRADYDNVFQAKFRTSDGKEGVVNFLIYPEHQNANVTFSIDGHMETTREGDAFRILATVSEIMQEFGERRQDVMSMAFSASVDNSLHVRERVYDKMIARFARNWNVKKTRDGYYFLTRKSR